MDKNNQSLYWTLLIAILFICLGISFIVSAFKLYSSYAYYATDGLYSFPTTNEDPFLVFWVGLFLILFGAGLSIQHNAIMKSTLIFNVSLIFYSLFVHVTATIMNGVALLNINFVCVLFMYLGMLGLSLALYNYRGQQWRKIIVSNIGTIITVGVILGFVNLYIIYYYTTY